MDIGAVVVEPGLFCPRVFAAGFVVEEDDVCFYAVGVKDYCGEVNCLSTWLSNNNNSVKRKLPNLHPANWDQKTSNFRQSSGDFSESEPF